MRRSASPKFDDERTMLLNLEDIQVEKGVGGPDYYSIWNTEDGLFPCPYCGSDDVKVQDLFFRDYKDIIFVDNSFKPVTLTYNFHKYHCLNPECKKIFAKDISFASTNDNLTYRFENEIAKRIIERYSYQQVSDYFSGTISKQAVGQVFNRWVRRHDENRRIKLLPKSLAIVSGETEDSSYTLFLNISDGIRIFDIAYGVSSDEIASFLRNNGFNNVETVLTDCNPTIYDVVIDCLPQALYIIPVQYWFDLVKRDFIELAHEEMRWSPVSKKEEIITNTEDELKSNSRVRARDQLLDSRPILKEPYADYHELRNMIYSPDYIWSYNGLSAWMISARQPLKDRLRESEMIFNAYREELYQHELHKEAVPEGLVFYTDLLEEQLREFRTFSKEVLRARVLYSVSADFTNWQGIPIKDVTDRLARIIDEQEENYYE